MLNNLSFNCSDTLRGHTNTSSSLCIGLLVFSENTKLLILLCSRKVLCSLPNTLIPRNFGLNLRKSYHNAEELYYMNMGACATKYNVGCIYTFAWLIFSLVFITLLPTFNTLSGPKADSYNLVDGCDWLQAITCLFSDMFVLMFLWHLKLAFYPSKGTRNASPVFWHWSPVQGLSCKTASNTSHLCNNPAARMKNLNTVSEQWRDSYRIQIGQCSHCGY